jgi:hypothetical protein
MVVKERKKEEKVGSWEMKRSVRVQPSLRTETAAD